MLSTVQAVRAKYPTPLGARHAAFLLEVAKATGKGLLRKDGGTNIELPDGTRVAQDIVMERDGSHHYDILGDGEGAATPGWDDKGPIDASRYYDVGGASVPTDPTGPTGPSGPDHDEVLSRLRSLESAIGEIRNRIGVAEGSADAAKATATHMFEAATTAMAEMRADISKLPTGGGGGLSEADVEDVIKQYHVTVNVFGREYSAPLTKKKRA